MNIKSKKGIALNESFGAVLTLILLGLLVIVAIFMFTSIGVSFPDITHSNINETGATINTTAYTLVNASDCGFSNPSIITAINATRGEIIASGNYTLSSAGLLTNKTATVYEKVNVTYSWTNKGAGCIATGNMVNNFTQYPALVGLVGTIIFLGIIIGVLVASFAFGKSKA